MSKQLTEKIEICSRYNDIVLNLEQIILISRNKEALEKNKKSLELYKELIEKYPDFEKMEKSTPEGYFPDLKASTHADLVYMMKDKLTNNKPK